MERFKSKYRIESTRLRHWDYSTPGFYFITICTRNREHFFGQVQDSEMFLNEPGKIADDCWSQIPNHFQNAELGDYIIMPNHVHGIIIINGMNTDQQERKRGAEKNSNAGVILAETRHALSLPHAANIVETGAVSNIVETGHALSQHNQQPDQLSPTHFRFRNQGRNTVSAMVGSFKSAVTRFVKPISKNFGWQSRFHDQIIRSQEEYFRISNYIRNNPSNWKDDRFY